MAAIMISFVKYLVNYLYKIISMAKSTNNFRANSKKKRPGCTCKQKGPKATKRKKYRGQGR